MPFERKNSVESIWFELIVLGLLAITFFSIFFIWKLVSLAPSLFEKITFKKSIKGAFFGFLLTGLSIFFILKKYSILTSLFFHEKGFIKMNQEILILWGLWNLFLGSLAYGLLPIWRKAILKKIDLRNQLY